MYCGKLEELTFHRTEELRGNISGIELKRVFNQMGSNYPSLTALKFPVTPGDEAIQAIGIMFERLRKLEVASCEEDLEQTDHAFMGIADGFTALEVGLVKKSIEKLLCYIFLNIFKNFYTTIWIYVRKINVYKFSCTFFNFFFLNF